MQKKVVESMQLYDNWTELQKDCKILLDIAKGMQESADWLALGEDYCNTSEKRKELDNLAHDMADMLVDVFNRIEEE